MKLQLIIRRFAGAFILASLGLAHYHSRNWLWFAAFVGFNLLQSSFTNFCPLKLEFILAGLQRELGLLRGTPPRGRSFWLANHYGTPPTWTVAF
jgi:hypothetical protein